jgi:DNA-binding IclR family transcriptional regulator
VLRKLNQVLLLFTAARPELAATDLAALLPYPRSTVYRLIARLTREGFLDHDEVTGLYRLGIWLAALGDIATHSTSLQRLAVPTLRRVSAETEETTTLMLRLGNEAIDVDVVESYQPLMTPGLLGGHMPLYASAGGKALVAWLPETVQRELIIAPLKRFTPTTKTDLNALWDELALSRQRGYTTVDGEFLIDVVGVAAPLRNHREEVVGAMTIGGPRSRLTPKKLAELGAMVVEAARDVSSALGSRAHGSGVR